MRHTEQRKPSPIIVVLQVSSKKNISLAVLLATFRLEYKDDYEDESKVLSTHN